MGRLQLDPLTDSRERLQAALDASKTGTWRWDIPANTLDWDDNLNRLFGLSPVRDVPTLSDFLALVHPEDRPTVDAACQRSIEDGSATRLEYRVQWADGSLHWIDDRGRTVFGEEGRPLYMTGACVDITDRKEAERILHEAELRKDDFLAMLAHELRNPLAPIRTSIEILRQINPGEGRAGQAHAIIDRQLGHLVRLVDDLLDVSRLAGGKIELRKERCSLTRIVQQTVDDYRAIFRDSGIAITASLPPDDLWINGDPTRLSQIVSNVLHNSSKFTARGGWAVVRLCRRDNSRAVVLEIEDSGSGMDAEMLERLFEPFAQGASRDRSTQGGLGLGLAVVRGLTELHGGEAGASSAGPDRGTTITLQFPAADAPRGGGSARIRR